MTSQLRNELLFGARALLRDNPASQWRLRALQRNESMSGAKLEALQASLLHKTLRAAIARLPFYAHIPRDFPVSAAAAVLRSAFPIIGKDTLLANKERLYPNRGARRNRYNRQLLVSSRHLSEAHADAIIDRLESVAPAMLQAYPSTAFTLAGLLERRSRRLRIPLIFLASEPLHAHQRALIAERLGGRIMDMYGMAGRVAFATECEHGQLHVNPDYAYVEIVDDDGQPTDGEGCVVGTTLHNHAMPLVRYRLSDRTRWKPGLCACGRAFPMIDSVSGKLEDAISGSNGAPVSASVLTFALKGVENIRKSQVAQVGPASWELRVVPLPGFSRADEQ